MKRASLILAVCAGLAGAYVLEKCVYDWYPETKGGDDFVVWRDDLSEDGKVSTEWAFFVAPDFPTGKCEVLVDVPMSAIGLTLLGISLSSGFAFLVLHKRRTIIKQ